jgi:hydroxyethylthiazole kinase-like uncharacterized protein yjeF
VTRRPATVAVEVETVRRLEAAAMEELPAGALMARAATGLAIEAGSMLRDVVGRVTGSRVVLLVGAGDNGGDALYAGARLARRGARVDALLVADRHHEAGAAALTRAGGRVHGTTELVAAAELVAQADLVVDGILGIGGRGALRDAAAMLAGVAREVDASVLAVDLPSGVDADTGAVADHDAVVAADRTAVFGVLKPGLLVGEGAAYAGDLAVVDIGLDLGALDEAECLVLVDDLLAAAALPRPHVDDDKYSRGVVGLSTGSARYPGAGVLSAGGARAGLAGLVRHVGPAGAAVVAAFPDVVAASGTLADAGRAQCWVVGSGRGTDDEARQTVLDAIATDGPLVLDADALTVVATDAAVRDALRGRSALTLLTPHAGELARITGAEVGPDRLATARALAADLGVVVLLKGSATVVAGPEGAAYVALAAPAELATAGSGDVLGGFAGSLLAHHEARNPLGRDDVARLAAVAAHVHGVAGAVAVGGGSPVTAVDLVHALPEAVQRVRRAGHGGGSAAS